MVFIFFYGKIYLPRQEMKKNRLNDERLFGIILLNFIILEVLIVSNDKKKLLGMINEAEMLIRKKENKKLSFKE